MAAQWLLGETTLRVIDLAAGTGIFTRLLVSLGHEVVAVEPDEAMLMVLSSKALDVEAHVGRAESIPLPSGSADAVVVAQAHWWFDPNPAYAEIARVLQPGGLFGAIWNGPDVRVPWVAEFQRIESGSPSVQVPPPDLNADFDPPEHATFEHSVRQTGQALIEILRSRAYFITASEEDQNRVDAEMQALVATLPPEFDFPYITYAVRSRRR